MYKVLVIDTETGGLDPMKQSILSVGAVVLQDGEVKDEFYQVLREESVIADERALQVNGFTVEEIEHDGTEIRDALFQFKAFLRKNGFTTRTVLAGHNVGFDVGFLKRWFRLSSTEKEFDSLFSYRLIDTASIAQFLQMAGLMRPMQSSSLDNVSKEFHLSRMSNEHNALEDAKLTAQLLTKMIERVKEVGAV